MKTKIVHEYDEGPQATERFKSMVKALLAIPHVEMLRREEEYQKQQAMKPKRGPKRKVKPFASPDPADV